MDSMTYTMLAKIFVLIDEQDNLDLYSLKRTFPVVLLLSKNGYAVFSIHGYSVFNVLVFSEFENH